MQLSILQTFILFTQAQETQRTISNDRKYYLITNFVPENPSHIISFSYILFKEYNISAHLNSYVKNADKKQKNVFEVMYDICKLIAEVLHDQMTNTRWSKNFFVFFDHQDIISRYYETKDRIADDPKYKSYEFCDDVIRYNTMIEKFYYTECGYDPLEIDDLYFFMYMLDFVALQTYSNGFSVNYKKIEKYFKRFILEKTMETMKDDRKMQISCSQIYLYNKKHNTPSQNDILSELFNNINLYCVYYVDSIYTLELFNKVIYRDQSILLTSLLKFYNKLNRIK